MTKSENEINLIASKLNITVDFKLQNQQTDIILH